MALTCPRCGTENPVDTSIEFIGCSGCDLSLYIDVDGIQVVFSEKPCLESNQVSSCLSDFFERINFKEKTSITDVIPLYFPFWEIEGKDNLEIGSFLFPGNGIQVPTETKTPFHFSEIRGHIGIVDISTQPQGSQKKTLIYLPFYKVTVLFREKEFTFFISAVNGEVSGEPIPYISSRKIFKLFPLFMATFLILVVFCFLFDHILIALASNLAVLFTVFYFSSQQNEKKHSEK